MERWVRPRTYSAVENCFFADALLGRGLCYFLTMFARFTFSLPVLKCVWCEFLYHLLFQIVIEWCSIQLISFLQLRVAKSPTSSLRWVLHFTQFQMLYMASLVGALISCINSSFARVVFSLDLNPANLYLGSSNVPIPYSFLISSPLYSIVHT